jgi:hypothetical protein
MRTCVRLLRKGRRQDLGALSGVTSVTSVKPQALSSAMMSARVRWSISMACPPVNRRMRHSRARPSKPWRGCSQAGTRSKAKALSGDRRTSWARRLHAGRASANARGGPRTWQNWSHERYALPRAWRIGGPLGSPPNTMFARCTKQSRSNRPAFSEFRPVSVLANEKRMSELKQNSSRYNTSRSRCCC